MVRISRQIVIFKALAHCAIRKLEQGSKVQKFKTPLSSLSTGGLVRIPRKHGLWLSPNVDEYNLLSIYIHIIHIYIYKSSINQAFELWSPGIVGYLDHPHMQTMAIPWLSHGYRQRLLAMEPHCWQPKSVPARVLGWSRYVAIEIFASQI